MRGRGAWRRAKVHRHTPPLAGGNAGVAIGRLGRRDGECRKTLCRDSSRGRMSTQLYREMRTSHLRPDMPLCHAKGPRAPKTLREARVGGHGAQFMDAPKSEVFCLLEAGAFEIVDE